MFTLIARELRDHSVYLGVCCVLSIFIVATLVYMIVYGITSDGISVAWLITAVPFLCFGVLGTAQMYGDRANRVSTLLSTQAVTRSRILVARILAGVVIILVTLIPVLVTGIILFRVKAPPLEFYSRMVWDISAVLVLVGLLCHSVGLLIGWTSSKARLMAGFFCLMLLLLSLVVVKGFGPWVVALLALLILAVWGRIWHTFTSASL